MTLQALLRKGRQVASDPALRHWLIERALGRCQAEPAFTPHRPPYLGAGWAGLALESPTETFVALTVRPPTAPIVLRLPGESVTVAPDGIAALFERAFTDTETLLGLHRFAWLPLAGPDIDAAWVAALWQGWMQRFGVPGEGWPWHPYTAAERAVNIVAFAQRHGLPGPEDESLACLAAHGPAIAERLEYFGCHHSSNHLANNGRGLYLLGLGLGLAECAELGRKILLAEAERIFLPSGVLREGSSHYHLLLTRGYASAWAAARALGRKEAVMFEAITRRLLSVLPHVELPGGMPLIGDVSPDCPPDFLLEGWAAWLAPSEQAALKALRASCAPVAWEALAKDGWLRVDAGPWAALFHAAPEGWSHMPGHGHQDCGSFALHCGTERVFVDPGRGAYGETGEAALYRSALLHNTIQVDGADPYPPNKPYYDASFRRRLGGAEPVLRRHDDGASLRHEGFSRLRGVGAVERRWRFDADSMTIDDRIEGQGRRQVLRRLVTPLPVRLEGEMAMLQGAGRCYAVTAEGVAPSLQAVKSWTAYGESVPATAITFEEMVNLPYSGRLRVSMR